MRIITSQLIVALCTLLTFPVVILGVENCPGIGSPEATANNYKLFAAYQTGYDGYEAPCELKCFANSSCQNRCQAKEALRLLENKMNELVAQNNATQCPSYTLSCLSLCEKQGVSCAAVCGGDNSVADKMPASENANKL